MVATAFFTSPLHAQETTGQIQGRIVDTQGLAVPGASVTATGPQGSKSTVTDAEVQAEYDKVKSQASGTEYRARHILVEKEDDAKALIAQIKAGARFEDLAKKNSKDPGSAENGGDLDFASPTAYVPEFAAALLKLKKGEMTDTPVKTQFGYHVIRLDDTRQAQFPALADVKPQIQQRLAQQKAAAFRDELRAKAKTDYKFSN
jgi:peptidyl-prolyl cis-trans isomerase C